MITLSNISFSFSFYEADPVSQMKMVLLLLVGGEEGQGPEAED